MTHSFIISEPPDWTPEPHGDLDYYQKHYDTLTWNIRFHAPEPKQTSEFSRYGADLPTLTGFAITLVEKRQA